jgi:hypothetical protein
VLALKGFGRRIMEIKIGYCPWNEKNSSTTNTALNYYGWVDLAHYELEKLSTWEESTSKYHQCPAFTNYVNQFYVVRNSVDIILRWDRVNKVLHSNLSYECHNSFVRLHWGDFDPETANPIVALSNSFVFVSDHDVYIEMLPPFNDIDKAWRLIPGSFNIGNWYRPFITTFEMLENEIHIPRGQPMAYVKFRTPNIKDKIKLVKIERTEQLEHAVNSSLTLKHFIPKISWRIHNSINKLKPKTWFTKK